MRLAFAVIVAGYVATSAAFASQTKDIPSWVQEASTRTLPSYSGRVPATVILSEQHVVIDSAGMVTLTERKAIKILTREGQSEAQAVEEYSAHGRRIREFRGWLVAPNGFSKTYDKNSISDYGAFDQMELYNDIRVKRIAAEKPEIGSVFAFEAVVEEKSLFAQDEYSFQTNLPAVQSRYVLTVPPGWKARAIVFNHEPLDPMVDGSTYTWELRNLAYREKEEHGPSLHGLAPRLAIDFEPPASASAGMAGACFRSWADVAHWHSALSAGQDELTPEMTAKVAELTSRASNDLEKLQAIGQYVQKVKYVAIEMDLEHGGGYKPHAADSVFRKQYGDCKDKANLMKAMLKAAGFRSELVAIYAGDRNFVKEQWPSATQFNHMILAVRVPAQMDLPSVIKSTSLGPLLIFDPTAETTPMGDLPWFEQGSFALVCAGEKGTILKMPVIDPAANSIEVTVDGTMAETGALAVSLIIARRGQPAAAARAAHLYNTPEQYRREVEMAVSRAAKSVTLDKLDIEDNFTSNSFRQTLAFDSQAYAQIMQRRLMVFSMSVVEPAAFSFPRIDRRTEPIVLRAETYHKHVRIKVPAGFTIDELPESVKDEADFGHYSLTFHQEPGEISLDETLRTEALTLPAEDYERVKKFFDNFGGADQQRAVLVKN